MDQDADVNPIPYFCKMILKQRLFFPALLIAGGFAFLSCSEPATIGIEVQPEGDQPGVFFTDTLTVEAVTIREDSLQSDESAASLNLAGSIMDPVFGRSNASFYTQVQLPGNNAGFTFGTEPHLDSVVLTLAYADYFGDTTTPVYLWVSQIEESFSADTFYTNDQLATGDILFASNINVRPKDSVLVDGAKRAPHLRLKLDDLFGNHFISATPDNFLNDTSFTNFFKGIRIHTYDATIPGQGVIMSFNLLSSMSQLGFYYKNESETTQKTAFFEFNSNCKRFNRFDHDYSLAEFGNNFPVPGDNKLYIQSMAGLKVRLQFPHLNQLAANGPVAINKAELIIPVTDNAVYKNHTGLILFGVDSAGGEILIPDLLEPVNYYGGSFSTTDTSYSFRISRYLQQSVSGTLSSNFGLNLVGSAGAVTAFRTVIPGNNSTASKIKLKITYSKLN